MNKILLSLLALSATSSAFAADSLIGVKESCISIDEPISFVVKEAFITSTTIEVDGSSAAVELSNGSLIRGKGEYSNKWNTHVSDATLALKVGKNGTDLKGTIKLTDLRKEVANMELQNGGIPACITGMTFSVNHGGKYLVGGRIQLFLDNTDSSIELVL